MTPARTLRLALALCAAPGAITAQTRPVAAKPGVRLGFAAGTLFNANGLGFGLGFQTTDRYGANGMVSVGSFGWGGAYGSSYWVDPKERLVVVFMIQQLPNSSDVAAKFPTLVYQALVEAR